MKIVKHCNQCGDQFTTYKPEKKYCSNKCRAKSMEIPFEVCFKRRIGKQTPDGCVPWIGKIAANGYGRMGYRDKVMGYGRTGFAHRIAWSLANGDIPKGFYVCHKCDNPKCVRVSHLFIGTAKDNVADAVRKGRMSHGEKHYRAKLSWNDVLDIRASRGLTTGHELARKYGISRTQVFRVMHMRGCWKMGP